MKHEANHNLPESMGASVTPHAVISPPDTWKYLACGVDTLDLALTVDWSESWETLSDALRHGREVARVKDKPVPFSDTELGPCQIYPFGKRPNYAYRLEVGALLLFVGDAISGEKWPNVYASIRAKTLWLRGVKESVRQVEALIRGLGGAVSLGGIKPSRCDLCADFHIPGGLSVDLLRQYGVSRTQKTNVYMDGDALETFYLGSRKGPLQVRIYDKSKEVLKSRKFWMFDVYEEEHLQDIWRIEFQLRRTTLKQFGVYSVDDLVCKLGGIWKNLTHKFYSMRLHDNPNVSRRTALPLWQAVQGCAEKFGPAVEIGRNLTAGNKAGSDFYITRGANALLSHAAIMGHYDLRRAADEYARAMVFHWSQRDFEAARVAKTIEMGKLFERIGGSYGSQ